MVGTPARSGQLLLTTGFTACSPSARPGFECWRERAPRSAEGSGHIRLCRTDHPRTPQRQWLSQDLSSTGFDNCSAAPSFVGTIQTGQLDTVRENLTGRQQAAVEYGVGATAAGVTRFLFGGRWSRQPGSRSPALRRVPGPPSHPGAGETRRRHRGRIEPGAGRLGGRRAGDGNLDLRRRQRGRCRGGDRGRRRDASIPERRPGRRRHPGRTAGIDRGQGRGRSDRRRAGTVGGAAASLFKSRKRGRHAADTDTPAEPGK